jgi:hypothetical protein
MDILNWLYLAKNKFVRTSIDNPKDLMIFGAKVGFNKRGDVYQNYAMEINDFAATLPAGPTGPQGVAGVAGPAGAPGPVGPAGLNWQGAWSAAASYVVDDAVGYAGASWFCIDPVGPSATPPNADPTNWALLAAQGATGATGATGLQGPTGAAGPSNALSIGTVTTLAAGSSATATITGSSPVQTLNLGIPQGTPGGAGSALVYIARVFQTGSALPTLIVKENTTVGTWTITQFNPGQFFLTNPSYSGILNHRIVVFATKGNDAINGSTSIGYVAAGFDGSQIWLNLYNNFGSLSNGIMGTTGMNLEIRIYPS